MITVGGKRIAVEGGFLAAMVLGKEGEEIEEDEKDDEKDYTYQLGKWLNV